MAQRESEHDVTRMMDANALAAELRVTPATIYRLAERGELPHIRVGKALRFVLADVLKALAGRKPRASTTTHNTPPSARIMA